MYFLVMQNVFFPVERIESRFDLKGCLGGRYQKVCGFFFFYKIINCKVANQSVNWGIMQIQVL